MSTEEILLTIPEALANCRICPHECGADRINGHAGICCTSAEIPIASICIHKGEEPPVSGKKGICNVFFAHCNLSCVYCQNHQISSSKTTDFEYLSLEETVRRITSVLDQGIEAVGFVSPTHVAPHVKAIVQRLRDYGYNQIVFWNSNGYDSVQVLREMDSYIDVYLPDFKYIRSQNAKLLSGAEDYPRVVKNAIREMLRQRGPVLRIDDNGQAYRGIIIRHLVLPGYEDESIEILEWIAENLSTRVSISLMSQYYPPVAGLPEKLQNSLQPSAYKKVTDAFHRLGFENGWLQSPESNHIFRPDFNSRDPFA
jgi:putative pyruvate formate lyase activating enzyme